MIIIKNGTIYDGIGNKPFKGSIVINGSKIAAIKKVPRVIASPPQRAKQSHSLLEIDASDKFVLPGFIDIHSHADLNVHKKPIENPKLIQGVTTEIAGNCGFSLFSPGTVPHFAGDCPRFWGLSPFCLQHSPDCPRHSLIKWIKMWEGIWGKPPAYPCKNPAQNVFSLIGYGTLRYLVAGFENRPLTVKESGLAKKTIYESIKSGAPGLSFGMVYAPCAYALKEELIEMAGAAARAGGYLAVHMRNEGDGVVEALNETIEIAKRAGAPLEISHMKAYGRKNWHKFDNLLEIIEKENARGNKVNFDIYPYTAGSTTLSALLPNRVKEGGKKIFLKRIRSRNVVFQLEKEIKNELPGWENFLKETKEENIKAIGLKSEKYRKFEGKSLLEISRGVKKTVVEALCDLLSAEDGGGEMLMFGMLEENVRKAMESKYSMFGTDGLFGGRPHPRTYGTYPRIIQKYVLKEKVLTMAEAVKKMSVMPAQKARIAGRGTLKAGNFADIVIIDPAKIRENSTFDNPARFPSGIDRILINGRII